MRRKNLIGALSYLVSGGLLVWILRQVDLGRILDVISHAQWGLLAVSAVLVGTSPCLATLRWTGILRAQKGIHVSYWIAFRATMLANVLNTIMPSKSGDMAKSLFLRQQANLSLGIGTVILERMVDLFMLGLLALLGYALSHLEWSLITGGMLVVGVPCALVILHFIRLDKFATSGNWFIQKMCRTAEGTRSVFQGWINSPVAIGLTFLGSFGVWTLSSVSICVLISGLGIDLRASYAISIVPLAVLAGLVPVSISGIGTRDAVFVILLSDYLPRQEAILIAIGYTFLAYWFIALLALPFAAIDIRRFARAL